MSAGDDSEGIDRFLWKQRKDTTNGHYLLEAVIAFFGLASIVIGSFADRLTGESLRARQAASTERQYAN
jgi:hypothetical protein